MKKVDLGQTINTLANIGVIAGILFLGMELQQNNEALEFQSSSERDDRRNAILEVVLAHPEYIDLMTKDEQQLSAGERDRLVMLGIRTLLNYESYYEDMVRGTVSAEETARVLRSIYWRPRLNYGLSIAWDTFASRADPEFVEWMEENVISAGPL